MLLELDNALYKAAIKKANQEDKTLKGLIVELLQSYTQDTTKEETPRRVNKEECANDYKETKGSWDKSHTM
ncbi:hypothetical protein NVP1063O_123 [Vibrio phage 1.063.O._10N.261.45.C7]|nr:hypothetical protein NVP1063O_123 [Vibrio phage 1.063.O._10N.261.45.C7]